MYRDFANSTYAARTGMNQSTAPNSSYGGFRMFLSSLNQTLVKEYEAKEADKRKWKDECSQKKYIALCSEADRTFHDMVKNRMDMLIGIIDTLANNHKASNRDFIMTPPRQEKLLVISTAEPRLKDMTETERDILIASVSDNYQESAYLHSLFKKVGIDYDLPYEPEKYDRDVDGLTNFLKTKIIPNIAKDPSTIIALNQFLGGKQDYGNDDPNSPYFNPNILCERFDSVKPSVPATRALPELTDSFDLRVRTLSASITANSHDDSELFAELTKVYDDIKTNGMNSINLHQAESLIATVNEKYPNDKKES